MIRTTTTTSSITTTMMLAPMILDQMTAAAEEEEVEEYVHHSPPNENTTIPVDSPVMNTIGKTVPTTFEIKRNGSKWALILAAAREEEEFREFVLTQASASSRKTPPLDQCGSSSRGWR